MPTSRSEVTQYQYLYERPSAQAFGIGQCQVAGIEYFSNGTRWIGGMSLLGQGSTGWIVPALVAANAATYTQAGTLVTVVSTGHLMTAAANNGRNIYLGLTGGTGVAGWFSNFTYVDANTFTCTSAISATDSGNVLSNTVLTTISPISVTVPAKSMGPNGRIRLTAICSNNNSAGVKTLKTTFGGTIFIQIAPTTTTCLPIMKDVINRGVETAQIGGSISASGTGATSSGIFTSAIDTTANTTVDFSLTIATASDWMSIEAYSVELLPG